MFNKRNVIKYTFNYNTNQLEEKDLIFYDVFCGGGNFIQNVSFRKRVAIDWCKYCIESLKVIRDCPEILPKNSIDFSLKDYDDIKNNKNLYPYWLVGYVGYALSWGVGGIFFISFRKPQIGRDYVAEAYRSALKQSKLIQGVEFVCSSYDNYAYNKNSIIYCDPPYYNTIKYRIKFDHNKFYSWCINMAKKGYVLYVSEYDIKEEYKKFFNVVWYKETKQQISKAKRIEKLFKVIV